MLSEVDAAQREILPSTLRGIEHRMRALFDERVPVRYLVPYAYGGVHPVLLGYLIAHVGAWVPASHLRVLTGDQVHTERRVRELRDVGFDIVWESGGRQVTNYRLVSPEPDIDFAARFQLEHRIKADRSLSATGKMLSLLQAELGRVVHTSRLKGLSGGQTQYDRRIRELRERFPISTGLSKQGLRPDEYELESLEEKLEHDHFKPAIRDAILRRDDFTCVDCNWRRGDSARGGHRFLEAHHVVYRAAMGQNTAANGLTLCNVCHDARHTRELS